MAYIHVGYAVEAPTLRVAVPIFFIVSSYFFFIKITKLDKTQAEAYYTKFIIRTCKLYLFWFMVCLPYLIFENIYHNTLIDFFIFLPFNIFLRSTFPASWYLAALVIGISFVYYTRRYPTLQVFLGFFLYIICCLETNYSKILFAIIDNIIPSGQEGFGLLVIELIRFPAYLSFPAGILFITIGKLLIKYRGVSNIYNMHHFGINVFFVGK